SFGSFVCKLKKWNLWNVAGEVNRIWSNELYHRILDLLKDNEDKLRPPRSTENAKEPNFALRCYMVGVDRGHANPHAAIVCGEKYFSKEARRIVLQHRILQEVGWGRAFLCLQANIERPVVVQGGDDPDPALSTDESSTARE